MLNLIGQISPIYVHRAGKNSRLKKERGVAKLEGRVARFKTAIDNTSQGICFFDAHRRLVVSNPRYAEIYGLSPNQIRPGMTLRAILALRARDGGIPDMSPDEYLTWTYAQASAHTPDGTTFPLKNGRSVSVRYQSTPDGGYVSTHEDITERLAGEAAMRQGEKLRAVGQMAAGVAHDLNNVLTVIGGTIEDVLERHTDLGGARADLTSVMASIDSATGLLRRMVSFSHARPPLLELTDLDAWLLRLRDMLTRMLGPHIGFELRQTPTLQAMLVDRSQLESALLNLILNARDAMPKGGSIVVETESLIVPEGPVPSPLGLPGPYVAITVRDTGAGMPPAMAKRAFEPFFSSKPFGSGTGLGLVMVQQFARQAGGSVSLSSSPGVGTSIRIMLPTASV